MSKLGTSGESLMKWSNNDLPVTITLHDLFVRNPVMNLMVFDIDALDAKFLIILLGIVGIKGKLMIKKSR